MVFRELTLVQARFDRALENQARTPQSRDPIAQRSRDRHDLDPMEAPMLRPPIAKTTNSALIGTDLEARLRSQGIGALVIAGVITNNSVEATVRMAGNLGFEVQLAEDACFTFARRDYHGRLRSAEEVHAMSLANLEGEYCRVTTTAELLA